MAEELYDINNDFRNAIMVLKDIDNKFNTLKLKLTDINDKVNIVLEAKEDINNRVNTSLGVRVDMTNNIHTHKKATYDIKNDIRIIASWQLPGDAGVEALGKSAFAVKINGVDKTSLLDLDSLNWKETLNSSSTASFVLAVAYDSGSCPSENQTVEILFNNHRKFYGYITNIAKISNPEGIRITAEDEYWNLNKTEVSFKVGRKISGDPDTYYTTIQQALSACGFSAGVGNFIPTTMGLTGSKADVISRLVQESGNFKWFINSNGNKILWEADKGSIINLEEQEIGKNLGLYQAINHNILLNSSGIINKFKVIMGEDIVPGYNNEFRFTCIRQQYKQYDANWMTYYRDNEPFSESQRRHISSIQFYDKRKITDTEAYEAYTNILGIGDFKITVPSGMTKGYPLRYKAGRYEMGVGWERDVLSENTKVKYSRGYWYDRGGIYPEGRRERTFEVTMGSYPQIIKRDLVLSNLNVQYGTNYNIWEGHNWSFSKEEWWYAGVIFPYKGEEEDIVRETLNKTGAYITSKSFKIASWNDVAYATDYANWQLSETCDIKERGTITITMDCADYYGLDLSKRINIGGVTSKPLNIVSIDYNVRSYLVTISVESSRYYKRTQSIPVHLREA